MEERITTLHPQPGKRGVNISKKKYEIVRGAIVELLRANGRMSFAALQEAVRRRLEGSFEGSISWYVTTVKLDLEAREVIARVPGSKPQELRLVDEARE